ncbi:MAG: hypothetical protein U0903_02685 [Planctomycetales bacterium]
MTSFVRNITVLVFLGLLPSLVGCQLSSAARQGTVQIGPDHSLKMEGERRPVQHAVAYRPAQIRVEAEPFWLTERLSRVRLWPGRKPEDSAGLFLVSGEAQVFQVNGGPGPQLPPPMTKSLTPVPESGGPVGNPQMGSPMVMPVPEGNYPIPEGGPYEDVYPRFSFHEDVSNLFGVFNSDFQALVQWRNWAYLGMAIGGTVLTSEFLDGPVADNVAEHPKRWNGLSETLELMGEFPVQFPALSLFYYMSLRNQDEDMHSLALALFSAYKFSGGGAWLIKLLTDTQRPSDGLYDGHYGFPSEEAATSFAMAAVLEEYYGWKMGLPAYALAGLISWSTIDLQDQYLSDVVFGAAFGLIIGKTIGKRHFEETYSWQVVPYTMQNPQATGMGLEYRY